MLNAFNLLITPLASTQSLPTLDFEAPCLLHLTPLLISLISQLDGEA